MLTIVGMALAILLAAPVSAAILNITAARTFGSLDGSIGEDDDGLVNGIFTRNDGLLITGTGSILFNDLPATNNSSAGTINILSPLGGLEMQSGAQILAEDTFGNGSGGNILVNLAGNFTMHSNTLISSSNLGGTGLAGNISIMVGGDVDLQTGSTIKADSSGSAGSILLTGRNMSLDGLISSTSTLSGTGANQPPGGGPITIIAKQNLLVSDTGVISSKGNDPGADLVHLEGCCVVVYGKVESTGVGHAVPNNPANHLNGANRPDKSPNSTAGVEIWAGDTGITIDNTGTHNGEIKADLSLGAAGRSYIDLLSRGDIKIIADPTGTFAVHATNGGNNPTGGTVQVKSIAGSISGSGQFINVSAAAGSGFPDGGSVTIEAAQNIIMNTAAILAQGDFNAGGGLGNGGHLDVRSFNALISWLNGVGDVRPVGTAAGLANPGTIVLTDINGVPVAALAGTSFPNNGLPSNIPVLVMNNSGGTPTLELYVHLPTGCIPEPTALVLAAVGLIPLAFARRRK